MENFYKDQIHCNCHFQINFSCYDIIVAEPLFFTKYHEKFFKMKS